MRLEQLEYLVTIARHRSINAAAGALHMTQQSLSNSMQSLEQELGVELLERTHRGISLTKNGQIVYDTALEMLSLWQGMQQNLTSPAAAPFSDTLRICSSLRIIDNVIPKPFNAYQRLYPSSTVICDDDAYEALSQGEIDFGYYDLILTVYYFHHDQFLDNQPPAGLTFVPLLEHGLLLAAHRDSEIAGLKFISAARLRKLAIRVYEPDDWTTSGSHQNLLINFYRKLGLTFGNVRYSNSITFCLQGVLDNLFCILCTNGSQAQLFAHPDIVFVPVHIDFKIVTGYLLPQGRQLSPAAAKFVEVFQQIYSPVKQ